MARTASAIDMPLGYVVSGTAHLALISWVLFGGVFQSTPEPFEISGVDVISLSDFEALFEPENVPAPETDVVTPVAPVATEAPELTSQQDAEIATPVVPTPATSDPDIAPEVVTPEAPSLPTPPEAPALPTPEPPSSAPEFSQNPESAPVRRVAPTPVESPNPELQIAEVDQAPTAPTEEASATEEAPEATAREEAATEIPTEPKAVASAPVTSLRPRIRPRAATPASSQPAVNNDPIAAALAEANAQEEAPTPARPTGPPLTRGERDNLRVAVQNCWNVDVGSQAADVVVTLSMSLDRSGKVQPGTLRLLSASGGSDRAQNAAFEAARRAVLRCQRGGYKLPIEKYDHWRDIEMTFNPENMRRR